MTVLARRDERSRRIRRSDALLVDDAVTRVDRRGPQAELVEPAAEVVGTAAHHRGEHTQVVAADREHLAVEVLALELDRGRVAGDHCRVVVVDLVQADQVDREAVVDRRPTGVGRGRSRRRVLPGQELVGGHP